MNTVDPKDQSSLNLPIPKTDGNDPAVPVAGVADNVLPQASTSPTAGSSISVHPIAPTPSSTAQSSSMPVMDDSNPQVAEDSDLIEQEWVDKAKAIVEHTKSDPYKQNVEMNKMKADYIKKRYGKDIKAPNE